LNYYNYFTEIEETFVRRRGKNLMLSPLDWALIETWQEREVPLHIVLRGIEKVFDTIDKQPARKRSVKSLFYCKEEIEAQFSEWLESQVGKNGGDAAAGAEPGNGASEKDQPAKGELFSDAALDAHLAQVSDELQAALETAGPDLREALERAAHRLAELAAGYESAEKLEASLEKLDQLVDESLLATEGDSGDRRAIEKQLAAYQSKMEREVFERTVNLMLLKKLRAEAKIPHFSLFYL
jgi:hypothetical protein